MIKCTTQLDLAICKAKVNFPGAQLICVLNDVIHHDASMVQLKTPVLRPILVRFCVYWPFQGRHILLFCPSNFLSPSLDLSLSLSFGPLADDGGHCTQSTSRAVWRCGASGWPGALARLGWGRVLGPQHRPLTLLDEVLG